MSLMMVLGLITILAVAVFTVVQPQKRTGNTLSARREFDIVSIKKAVENYTIDNYGLPSSVYNLTNNIPYMIVMKGGSTVGTVNCTSTEYSIAKADIFADISNYLSTDPQARRFFDK